MGRFPDEEIPPFSDALWDVAAITEDVALNALSDLVLDEHAMRGRLQRFDDRSLEDALQSIRKIAITSFELRVSLDERLTDDRPTLPATFDELEMDELLGSAGRLLSLLPPAESHSPEAYEGVQHYFQLALTFVTGVVGFTSSDTDLSTDLAAALLQMPPDKRRWYHGALDMVHWAAGCVEFYLRKEAAARQNSPGDTW